MQAVSRIVLWMSRHPPSHRPRPRPGATAGAGARKDRPRGGGGIVNEVKAAAGPAKADRASRAFEEAVEQLERGRPGAAVAAAEEAKALASRSSAVREVLGLALYRAARFREALRELQAYRRMTGRLDHNHLIADCQRAIGAPDKAVEAAREAAAASRLPDEVRAEATIVGASALADLGRFPEAMAMLNAFPSTKGGAKPFDLRLWYVRGDILERAGRRAEAIEEFRRVLRHDAAAFDVAERLAGLQGG